MGKGRGGVWKGKEREAREAREAREGDGERGRDREQRERKRGRRRRRVCPWSLLYFIWVWGREPNPREAMEMRSVAKFGRLKLVVRRGGGWRVQGGARQGVREGGGRQEKDEA